MVLLATLKEAARRLKREVMTVYFAARDPRTPWPVRLLAIGIAAYALSPIDLVPDVIPIIGYVDELLLLPLGIWLVMRLIPESVLADSRRRAEGVVERPVSRVAAAVIVVVWLTVAVAGGAWLVGQLVFSTSIPVGLMAPPRYGQLAARTGMPPPAG